MTTQSFAAVSCRIVLATLLAAPHFAFAQATAAAARAVPVVAGPSATSFAEASQLFRAGRHAAAYGRFARLASEGDREAARVALVMHRHGALLFGSVWDATTEELELWSVLAQAADRAEIAARDRVPGRALAVSSTPRETTFLSPETFRGDRRKKR